MISQTDLDIDRRVVERKGSVSMIKRWVAKHFNDISYQMNHFLLAFSFMLLWHWEKSVYIGGDLLVPSLLVIAFAAVKEFLWDPKEENASIAGSGILDFSFYMLGLGAALLILR